MTGAPVFLYHVADIAALVPPAEVWITEGEKDADRLREEGLHATTFPGWAARDRWREAAGPLAGQHVIIVQDNDKSGRLKAACAAAAAHGAGAASVRLLDFAAALTAETD